MTLISITEAREKLPKIMDEVYFNLKSFIVTRRGIPMVKIIKTDKVVTKKKASKKDVEKALKLARSISWIWNDKKWKNKSTIEIADYLREKAWNSHAS